MPCTPSFSDQAIRGGAEKNIEARNESVKIDLDATTAAYRLEGEKAV
jgi:hypothetical protein